MTVFEAAAYLCMRRGTLDNYRSLGIGPMWTKGARGKGGGRIDYTQKALDEWRAGRQCPTCGP